MSIVATATDQRYLVLIGLTTDRSLPFDGLNEADLIDRVRNKLEGTNSAGEFWREASYGKTSFVFDIHDKILDLPEDIEYYYRYDRPKTIEGSGASFPINWSGAETLELAGDDNLMVTITFPAGSMSIRDSVDFINEKIVAASADMSNPEIVASVVSGQIHLTTKEKKDDTTLEISGTALDELGLDSANRTVTEGLSLVVQRKRLVQHALEERVRGLSDTETETAVGHYDGVMAVVVGKDGDIRAGAITGSEEFPLNGVNYEFAWQAITTNDPWQVYAHEIGHNLGFPDLYEGSTPLVGAEIGSWGVMASSSASHPIAWTKTFLTENSWGVGVEVMRPPTGPDPAVLEVLLAPSESPLPTSNPFSTSHPNLPLTQIVRLDIEGRVRSGNYQSGNRALYVENRQRNATYAPPFKDSQYDTELPGSGVIITDAIDTYTGVLVNRSEVRFTEPDSGPISRAGDIAVVQRFGTNASLRVEVVDEVQSTPPIYHLRISWGAADRFDYRISPWNPPPWDSDDIWVDTNFANDWSEYKQSDAIKNPDVTGHPVLNGDESRVGWPSRVYARVHNDGNVDRTNVPVRFEVIVPAAIGPAPGQLIGQTSIDIPKRGSAVARVDWTPRASNEEHVCLRVVVDPDRNELSELNNEAQENLTEWYAEASSPYAPVEFRYQVANPLPTRAPIRLRAKGLTRGWTLTVDPYEFWLEAGEVIEAVAELRAGDNVPFDDALLEEGLSVPIISLEGLVLDDHAWVPFGGISGIAHAVRKTKLEVDIETTGSNRIIVFGQATSRAAPVGSSIVGATVGLRVFLPSGENVVLTRAVTDADGKFEATIQLPFSTNKSTAYSLDAALAPITGYGPATADIIRFTIEQRFGTIPRQ